MTGQNTLVKFHKNDQFIRIKNSYIDDSQELTAEDIAKRERLEKIHALRFESKYSRKETIQIILRDHKNTDGTPVSRATAYRDYDMAMQIFGDIDSLDRNIERMVISERYLAIAKKASKDGNLEAELKAIQAYEKSLGPEIKNPLEELIKYKSVEVKVKLSPKQKKIFESIMGNGVVDFNNFDAEDIEYQDVNENEDDDELE